MVRQSTLSFGSKYERMFVIDREIIVDVIKKHFVSEDSMGLRYSLMQERMDGKFDLSIKNGKQFDFCTGHVGSGQSFSMVVESARTARSVSHDASLVGIKDTTVRQYVQACISIKLQRFRTLLHDKMCWAYSTTFDSAKNTGDAYLYIPIRIHIRSFMHNIQLLAIPIRCSHTRLAVFHLASGIL